MVSIFMNDVAHSKFKLPPLLLLLMMLLILLLLQLLLVTVTTTISHILPDYMVYRINFQL